MPTIDGVTMTNLGPKVDIGKVFGDAITFAGLGTAFHTDPCEILVELTKAKHTNRKAFHDLYQELLKQQPWQKARVGLETQTVQYWSLAHGGAQAVNKHELPFLYWEIPPHVIIRLPKSPEGASFIEADANSASRYIQLAIDCPQLAGLELLAETLTELTNNLKAYVHQLSHNTFDRAKTSTSYLVSAKRLLVMMYESIPNTLDAHVDHHINEHGDLIDELRKLIEDGSEFICDDPLAFDKDIHKHIDEYAADLLAEFTDPHNIKLVEQCATYYNVAARRDIWDAFLRAVTQAGFYLIRSNRADDFTEGHLLPFLGALADTADVKLLLEHVKTKPLEEAIRGGWKKAIPQTPKTFFSTLGSIGSVGSGTIGNSRGPASVAVSLALIGGPLCSWHIMRNSPALTTGSVRGTALALRVLMRVAHHTEKVELEKLIQTILPPDKQPPNLKKLRNLNWSTKLMSGNLWAGAYAFANLTVFLSLVTSNDHLTLERFGQLIQSGAQLAVPLAEIASVLAKDVHSGSIAEKLLTGADRLAVFAGAIAFGLAGWTLLREIREYLEDDGVDFSDITDAIGSAATLASVGGWLCLEYLSTRALFASLMSIGSIVSISTLIATIGYHAATKDSGTVAYIRACLNGFASDEIGMRLLSKKSFKKDFDYVIDHLDRVKHKLVSFSGKQDELYTLVTHFGVDGAATIVEMEPDIVKHIIGVK